MAKIRWVQKGGPSWLVNFDEQTFLDRNYSPRIPRIVFLPITKLLLQLRTFPTWCFYSQSTSSLGPSKTAGLENIWLPLTPLFQVGASKLRSLKATNLNRWKSFWGAAFAGDFWFLALSLGVSFWQIQVIRSIQGPSLRIASVWLEETFS